MILSVMFDYRGLTPSNPLVQHIIEDTNSVIEFLKPEKAIYEYLRLPRFLQRKDINHATAIRARREQTWKDMLADLQSRIDNQVAGACWMSHILSQKEEEGLSDLTTMHLVSL
jgi:hypothetical protein